MELKDKYEGWKEIYWSDFIVPMIGGYDVQGNNIPLQEIDYSASKGTVGDGTINMSLLMQYIYAAERNGEELPITNDDVLMSLRRLVKAAKRAYRTPCVNLISTEEGFFMRDDIDPTDHGFKVSKVVSGYGGWLGYDEDPCYSPFVSQDQVWNLSPMLYRLKMEGNDEAMILGWDINSWIKDNGYSVRDPYMSWIRHYHDYLPSMNTDRVEPWERAADRMEKFRFTEKVKRGANNWYYSGGTSANVDMFEGRARYRHTLRTFLYRGIVFFLDRIWHSDLMRKLGVPAKQNAYYCYAAVSGIWYGPGFKERLARKFNESLSGDDLFEPNVVFLAADHEDIDWDGVKGWLDRFPEPKREGVVSSPIVFLYVYQWYLNHEKGIEGDR